MPTTTQVLSFDHLLPEGERLFDFQTVSVAYALVARRTFVADEMGLGKTRVALVAAEAVGAYPLVVVCPASLKGNWRNEVRRCLPQRTVEVVSGNKPYPVAADVIIVNYDILTAWAPSLAPQALVLDESHYVKTPTAKRTLAAQALAQRVPAGGLVLALTGTPLLNRPIELISQLDILGKLGDITGPAKDDDFEFSFKWKFCRNEKSKQETGKYTWDAARDLAELNKRLRANCMVRRLRKETLGTKDTHRVFTTLSLNGALDTYRKAEANVIRFLHETKGAAAARRAEKAKVLVELGTLRRLAGEAKVEAAIEWIDNFLVSNPDDSLVVFANHVEVQQALVAHYNCPRILAGQKDVEEQKAAFQAKQHRLIVCSLNAASTGHTLTAASTVLFTADQVTAFYLIAEDTIDEVVAALIESKRATFTKAIDGGNEAEVETQIQQAVIEHLYQKGA